MSSALSVRIDEEVQRALAILEAAGLTRSEAVRKSILEAAHALQRKEMLREEVATLDGDEADRAEMLEVAGLMESLGAEG